MPHPIPGRTGKGHQGQFGDLMSSRSRSFPLFAGLDRAPILFYRCRRLNGLDLRQVEFFICRLIDARGRAHENCSGWVPRFSLRTSPSASVQDPEGDSGRTRPPSVFREDSAPQQWKNRALLCASKAGLVNNLNDGLAWGLRFPRPVALTNQLSSQALFGGNCASRPGGLCDRSASR